MKKQKHSGIKPTARNPIGWGLALLLAVMAVSCQGPRGVGLILDDNGFPVLELRNRFGNDIILAAPSEDTGSIGIGINGQVLWARGEPVSVVSGTGTTTYTWDLNGNDSLFLKLEPGEGSFGMEISSNAGHVTGSYINIRAADDEYFTGVMERVVDGPQQWSWRDNITAAMNLRGQKVGVHVKPTVSAYAPFYITSANYSFFAKGTWPGTMAFCAGGDPFVRISFEGPSLTFTFNTASAPMELVQKHALETGPSVVPPDWALGPWRWRDEHFNNKEYFDGSPVTAPYNSDLVEDVLMMKHFDIPCSAVWIDRPWAVGSRGFEDYDWDTEKFPQPENMIRWLNGEGMELMLWIGPFVMGKMADHAEEMHFDLVSRGWRGARQVLMDFTNPEAVKWWGENGPGKMARMGIKGFKLDRADGEKLVDSIHLIVHDGRTYRENFNDYPRQYVKATYDAVQPVLGNDFILFPRAQYTGSAKYGGLWAGDTNGKDKGLRSALIAMQRCAVMGYPLWGSDNGGYWGQFNRETCMRWIGMGCFSPFFEVGPTLNHGFWQMPGEPVMDTMLVATWRLYAKVRMELRPYLKTLVKEASETGTPVARPLFLEYPDQEEAWADWQSYLLGPDVLVRIIWEQGKTDTRVWLPAGETWMDAWDGGKEYQGGQYIEVKAPLYHTPVFIRKGSDLDLGDLNALWAESLEIASKPFDMAELEQQETW